MKKIFFVITILSIGFIAQSQDQISVRFDRLLIYGINTQEDSLAYSKLPEILAFGLSNQSNKVRINSSLKGYLNPKSGLLTYLSSEKPFNSKYLIAGSIYVGDEITFSFEVGRSNGPLTTLESVFSSKNTMLAGLSQVSDAIYQFIKKEERNTFTTKVRYGLLCEITNQRRSILDSTFISNLVYNFLENSNFNKKAYLISWDTTKLYSFNNLKIPLDILKALKADLMFGLSFQQKNDQIFIKTVLYSQDQTTPIELSESHISLFASAEDIEQLRTNLYEIVNFLVSTEGLDSNNFNFLATNQDKNEIETITQAKRYLELKEYYKAAYLTTKALKFKPSNPEYHFMLSNIRASQGRLKEAIFELDRAIDNEPNTNQKLLNTVKSGRYYDTLKAYDLAIEQYKAVEKISPNFNDSKLGEINFLIGVALAKSRDYDQAILYLTKSKSIKPNVDMPNAWSAETCFWLGYSSYFNTEYEKAIENFECVIARNETKYPEALKYLAESYYLAANKNYLTKNYTKALDQIKKSLALKETEIGLRLLLRLLNRTMGFIEGRNIISAKINQNTLKQQILKFQGDDLRVLFYRNKLDSNYGKESAYYFKQYLKKFPTDSVALWSIGNVYVSMNNDSSSYFLEQALKLKYAYTSVYLDLAEAYIKFILLGQAIPHQSGT